jgi:hypothetical protein
MLIFALSYICLCHYILISKHGSLFYTRYSLLYFGLQSHVEEIENFMDVGHAILTNNSATCVTKHTPVCTDDGDTLIYPADLMSPGFILDDFLLTAFEHEVAPVKRKARIDSF